MHSDAHERETSVSVVSFGLMSSVQAARNFFSMDYMQKLATVPECMELQAYSEFSRLESLKFLFKPQYPSVYISYIA